MNISSCLVELTFNLKPQVIKMDWLELYQSWACHCERRVSFKELKVAKLYMKASHSTQVYRSNVFICMQNIDSKSGSLLIAAQLPLRFQPHYKCNSLPWYTLDVILCVHNTHETTPWDVNSLCTTASKYRSSSKVNKNGHIQQLEISKRGTHDNYLRCFLFANLRSI